MPSRSSLYIPDRPLAQWVSTYPKEHLAATIRINKECNGRFVPLVKIVKAWYRHQRLGVERPKPKGFTLEALVAQYQDSDAPTYAEAFTAFLANVDTACGHLLAQGTFPSVPDPGRSGQYLKLRMSPEEAKRFGKTIKSSLVLAREAVALTTIPESAKAWNTLFGDDFPLTPERSTRAFSTTEEEDEETIDEIAEQEVNEIDLPVIPQQTLKVVAQLSNIKEGTLYQHYPSGGRALPKDWWLRFHVAETSVKEPYEVRWIVENHGRAANEAHDTGHTTNGTSKTQWEHTKYRGSHTMICELHRNGITLARAEHKVNVK